jgi:RNA polymerase-binding protein DksA
VVDADASRRSIKPGPTPVSSTILSLPLCPETIVSVSRGTESASATLNREIDYTLGENSEQILSEIDAALKRIDDGTYGVCTRCGKEIGIERLEAYPWASLCIDDARKAER